jgi:hypothetical protein
MSSIAEERRKPKVGGVLPALLEVALSFGVYYLLRAFGVDVFWALTAPAIAVAMVAVVVTVRRRRVDVIGLLVLCEIAATLTLSLATHSARVAALREPLYFLISGVFCLATLFHRAPFSHTATSALATFGDPKRERAFEQAWREVPGYRAWQRLITISVGLIMVVAATIRAGIVYVVSDAQLAHAVDISTIISIVATAAVVVVSAILIQPPKKIIEELLERM